MNPTRPYSKLPRLRRGGGLALCRYAAVVLLACLPSHAHASIFKGEALDKVADVLTWVVLIVAPVVAITIFWLLHILPEKIAEKKQHPQVKAIQCLCLLSLVFGGLLWPLAWLWAYSKPVFYRMAYGKDKVAHGEEDHSEPAHETNNREEVEQLRKRVMELESKLAENNLIKGGKA